MQITIKLSVSHGYMTSIHNVMFCLR